MTWDINQRTRNMFALSYMDTSNILSTTITKQRKKLFGDILRNPDFKMSILKQRIEKFLHKSVKCDDEMDASTMRKSESEQQFYETIVNDAVILNKPKYVELLIERGAPLNNPSKNQMTPLEIAIVNNNYEICSMLLYYNCAQFPSRYGSHLIYAIYGGNNAEIQLLLLNYEVDVNVSFLDLSLLFIAIEKSQFLIPHLLNHGADVNEKNTIGFILMNPIPVAYFKLVWDKFDYQIWKNDHEGFDILSLIICSNTIPSDLWDGYLRTIIEDERIGVIIGDDGEPCPISDIVEQYVKRGFLESKYYDLICILLTHSFSVHFLDVHKIYNLLGSDSKILKLLLHMDIQKIQVNADFNFIRVHFCLQKPVNHLLNNLLYNMRIISMKNSYLDITRYFTLPDKVRELLIKQGASKYLYINLSLHKGTVPPLLELARNEARDFICKKYSVVNSGQYKSVVKHYLLLPEILKSVLTFECPIYPYQPSD